MNNSQTGREQNGISITARDFASDNNVSVSALRARLQYDNTIKPKFTRVRVHYYSLSGLTRWFENNIGRFNGTDKKSTIKPVTSFVLAIQFISLSSLGAKNGCCVDCREKARNRVIAIENIEETAIRVHTVKTKIDDIAAARILKDSTTDSWMNDYV
jgi:hypothetical protein